MDRYNLVHYKENAIRVSETETGEDMLYSVVDIVSILTHSADPRKYWNTQKRRLAKTDQDLIAGCRQEALPARDGKRRMTDVATAPVILELLKVIPGRDETEIAPFSRWLQSERMQNDTVMPFQTLSFQPGTAKAAINTIPNDNLRQMATAEYMYYTGNAEKAAEIAGLYLDHGEINIRITAAYIYAFATMHLHRHNKSVTAFRILEQSLNEARKNHSPQIQRKARMILYAARIIMNLPADDMEYDISRLVPELPEGLKTWACCIRCYELYRKEKFEQILGVVETANAFTSEIYPIPLGYLNAFAAIALVNQRRIREAEPYLDKVIELCQPDGMYEILGEMQIMLHGLVDVYIKSRLPSDAETIDAITNDFFQGWLAMRKLLTDGAAPAGMNKTEFIMAVLAGRGWKNREIANYLGFSENTVKKYLSNVFEKLNAENRQELTDILRQ